MIGLLFKGATKIAGKVIKSETGANKLSGKLIDAQSSSQLAQLAINAADANGGWLQRNWRPLFMMQMVLIVSFNFFWLPIAIMVKTGELTQIEIPEYLWLLFASSFGVYGLGRTREKLGAQKLSLAISGQQKPQEVEKADKFKRAKDLIKRWEGCHLKPYQDPIGLWTVGYGHLIGKGKVKPKYTSLTQAEVDELFDDDFAEHKSIALRCIAEKAGDDKAPAMNCNQIGAVASLVFNIGGGAFEKSTICKMLARGDFDSAAEEFKRWNKVTVTETRNGKTVKVRKVLNGLVKRRADEKQLFLSEV